MEKEDVVIVENKADKVLSLQDYLSIGYVFLLILGIFHESIYYKFIGINILDYTSLLDVLMSPIAVTFGNLTLGLVVILTVPLSYGYLKVLPRYHTWLGTKKKYQTGKNKLKLEKAQLMYKSKNATLIFISLFVFALFVGLGTGRGFRTKERIQNDVFELTHVLLFKDGEQKEVKLLGKNSLYVFYVTKGQDEVSITPIDGNIKLIRNISE